MSAMADFVAGLRAMADWYEAHPEQPRILTTFQAFVDTRGDLISAARALGVAQKNAYGNWFWVSRNFGGGVELQVNIHRNQVCTRRVTGSRIIQASTAREEEIVEWDCGPLLEEMGA